MLSDTQIRSAKPTSKAVRLYDERGLYLEVTPSGGRWWRLKYRFDGREKLLSMGTYPDTSLKAARDKRDRARELLAHRNITVITNNMNVANILVANPGCEIVVAGGALRRTDGGLVGELTTQFFEQFKVDYAVIGVSALDRDGDLLDFDLAEVRVSKAIIQQSRRSFLVADHSKLSEITTMFTDQPLPADLMRKCEGWGTAVQIDG